MPSREVARLRRLRLDTMAPERLREEIVKAVDAFTAETATREEELSRLQSTLRATTAELAEARRKLEAAEAAPAAPQIDMEALSATLRREVFALRDSAAAAPDPEALTARLRTLEAEKLSVQSENAALKALAAALEAEKAKRAEAQAPVRADALMSLFAEDVAKAAAAAPSGFEIGDVEVDFRGALGAERGALVLGLDAARAPTAETATRVRFTLRRKTKTTELE